MEGLGNTLTPTDVYDFYWICTALSYEQLADEDVRIAHFYLKELQDLYVMVFTELLTKQIEKYVQRGRIDMVQGKPAFDVIQIRQAPFHQRPALIKSMMAQTYRSDMQRRNEVWDQIADHLYNLANTGAINRICFYIDRINNSVHNTKTLVLDKLSNGPQLLQAFENCHRARNPRQFARFVSPEVRRLVRHWIGPGMQ
jgi:hypothetical protein